MSSAMLSLEALAATSDGVRKMPAPTTIPTVIATASLSVSVGTGAPRPPAFTLIRSIIPPSGTQLSATLWRWRWGGLGGLCRDGPKHNLLAAWLNCHGLFRCPVAHIEGVRDHACSGPEIA